MQIERRIARRTRVQILCNQYVDGVPFLGEALELSMNGALLRRVLAPDCPRATYAIEIGLPNTLEGRIWVCATPVWRVGDYEAVHFVAQSATDKLRLASLLSLVERGPLN
jgi:hypothetical protein